MRFESYRASGQNTLPANSLSFNSEWLRREHPPIVPLSSMPIKSKPPSGAVFAHIEKYSPKARECIPEGLRSTRRSSFRVLSRSASRDLYRSSGSKIGKSSLNERFSCVTDIHSSATRVLSSGLEYTRDGMPEAILNSCQHPESREATWHPEDFRNLLHVLHLRRQLYAIHLRLVVHNFLQQLEGHVGSE